ncbi:MAG: hypothetical protein SCALA701_00510 [Candidatus Scalindua sp.]|nr:MAG: hypothetical protein SCALA701_00510 [Candidatus Scalindua sp.]
MPSTSTAGKKNIILMISDGCGIKHEEATNAYTGTTPAYQSGSAWKKHWISTYHSGGSYNGNTAWSNFNYIKAIGSRTDSAAAATALYTGTKTLRKRISVSTEDTRLFTIGEKAKAKNMAVGAVSSVPVSHATPGAWTSHNSDRLNGYAIADEGFFENPNTTGSGGNYSGGKGLTSPRSEVIIGEGFNNGYVNTAIRNLLASESGNLGKHKLVKWSSNQDGGSALLAQANNSNVTRLAGLFKHAYHQADFSGFDSRNPTLSDSTNAALTVLNRNPNGFVLMVEGGAVDWAAHNNIMDDMIGEQKDFNNAVQTVINWVSNSGNGSNWNNTLVIVTSDHETGYLTAGFHVFPDDINPINNVTNATLAKEKVYNNLSGNVRASWEDSDSDNRIDAGETVYWVWHSRNHTNSLVPLYARGVGASEFATHATGFDAAGHTYLDNTDVFAVMGNVIGSTENTGDTPVMSSPIPSSTITTSTVTFQWSAGTQENLYRLHVGTTGPGSKDIIRQNGFTQTSLTVTGIPINGNTIYVRLWWKISGTWHKDDYTYQTQGGSGNQAPSANNDSATTPVNTQVSINVIANDNDPDGTIAPATVVVTSGPTNGTSLPNGNGTVAYTPFTSYSGQDAFKYTVDDNLGDTSNEATVTVTIGSSATPVMTSPTPGSTLTTSTVTFGWSAGTQEDLYRLHVGTTGPGSKDIIKQNGLTQTSLTVTGIPTDGSMVYVRLWWRIGSTWFKTDYTYQTGSTTADTPEMTSPTPSSTLTTSTVTFGWSAGTQEDLYRLHVGTTGPGSKDIIKQNGFTQTSLTVTGIPQNGTTVYVRLWYRIGGDWSFIDYTYQT